MDIGKDLQRAYDDGYEHGKQDAMKWIPVTERSPDYSGRFMCYYEVNDYGEIGHCIDWGRYDPDDGWYVSGVTHWMPLPEPPRGGNMKYTMSCMRLVPIKVVVEADDLNTARKELWKKLSNDEVESKYRHELMYAVDEDGFHFDAFDGKFIRSNSIRWEVDNGVAIKVKT